MHDCMTVKYHMPSPHGALLHGACMLSRFAMFLHREFGTLPHPGIGMDEPEEEVEDPYEAQPGAPRCLDGGMDGGDRGEGGTPRVCQEDVYGEYSLGED